MTHYKILHKTKCKTIIGEYWDDLEIKTYTVQRPYTGGDILKFIERHDHFCNINFENLDIYLTELKFYRKEVY